MGARLLHHFLGLGLAEIDQRSFSALRFSIKLD